MRKLLILSADFTGHGHKSISESLAERLKAYPDIQVKIIDGFDLMTHTEKIVYEKTYGPITRLPAKAWALQYSTGMKFRKQLQKVIAARISTHFQQLIREDRPDCILTVHPLFIGSVIDVLEEMGEDIPVFAHQADLIDIALQWFDPRIALTLAPSQEAYNTSVEHGLDPERMVRVGFPVRSRFMGLRDTVETQKGSVTLMSGSEGSGMLKRVVKALLKGTDLRVNVVCGRNKMLRNKLRKSFYPQYRNRLTVYGFVDDIQNLMLQSELLILRASPNTVMEGIALNKPIVLCGQLAGQELHNPDMLVAHGVAEYCPEPEHLAACVNALLGDPARVEAMLARQREFMPGDEAARTAAILNERIPARS